MNRLVTLVSPWPHSHKHTAYGLDDFSTTDGGGDKSTVLQANTGDTSYLYSSTNDHAQILSMRGPSSAQKTTLAGGTIMGTRYVFVMRATTTPATVKMVFSTSEYNNVYLKDDSPVVRFPYDTSIELTRGYREYSAFFSNRMFQRKHGTTHGSCQPENFLADDYDGYSGFGYWNPASAWFTQLVGLEVQGITGGGQVRICYLAAEIYYI